MMKKGKKILSILLSMILVLGLVPADGAGFVLEKIGAWIEVQAAETVSASGTCGDNLTWELSEDGVLTISGTGEMDYWYSEEYVPWYDYQKDIVTVVIENGVTEIGNRAFCNLTNLVNVTIPDSVIYIGNEAFNKCTSLKSVVIPSSVKELTNSFSYCTSLTNIILSYGITHVYNTFTHCTSLTSITIPDSVEQIDGAFYQCRGLTEITLGSGVTRICEGDFAYCSQLENIYVSEKNENLLSIDGVLFDKKAETLLTYPAGKKGESYEIPDSVTTIAEAAFSHNDNLVNIVIPDTVSSMGENAFEYCDSLVSVVIGDGLSSVSSSAFYECGDLKNVTFGVNVTEIGNGAFGSSGLRKIEIPDTVEAIYGSAFSNTLLYTVTVPSSVKIIGSYAFSCPFLKNAVILGQPESIGDYAFEGHSMSDIYYCGTRSQWVDSTSKEWRNHLTLIDVSVHSGWKWYTPSLNGWGFSNDSDTISEELFYQVFDSSKWKNHKLYQKKLEGKEMGLCQGMAVSSLLTYFGYPPLTSWKEAATASEFQEEDKILGSDIINVSLGDYIKLLWLYQLSGDAKTIERTNRCRNSDDYQDIIDKAREFYFSQEEPIAIAIKQDGRGHTLIPYKVEAETDEYKVYVYDSNWPKSDSHYITFYRSGSKITGWSYVLYYAGSQKVEWTSEGKDAWMTFYDYDNMITMYNHAVSESMNERNLPLLFTSSKRFSFVTTNQNQLLYDYGIVEGEYDSGAMAVTVSAAISETSSEEDAAFYIANGNSCTIQNSNGTEPIEICFVNDDSDITINADGNSKVEMGLTEITHKAEVTPSVTGNISITYTMDMGKTIIKITGKAKASVPVSTDYKGNELTVSGYENGTVTVNSNGKNSSATITGSENTDSFVISTDENDVVITEKTENVHEHTYGNPSFSWSDDCSAATVRFTCRKCAAVQEVNAIVSSSIVDADYMNTGKIVYKATVVFNQKTYVNTKNKTISKKILPEIEGVSTINMAEGIRISWKKVSEATGYYIYRNGTKIASIANDQTADYLDKEIKDGNGDMYYYTVQAYSSAGSETVTGSKSSSSAIVRLQSTKIKQLKKISGKKIKVKWKKNERATGYQIQYSRQKGFGNKKTITVKKGTTVAKNISKLKKGKKYYIRVRVYRVASGQKYYSAWSNVKKVKLKK